MQPKPCHHFSLTHRILVTQRLPPFEVEQTYTHPSRYTASNNPTEPAKEHQAQLNDNEVAQSCPTLCDPTDCSLPCSSIHGIYQARILEWVAISFSRRPSQPRDRTWVSRTRGRCFTIWATREAQSTTYPSPNGIFISDFIMQELLKVLFFFTSWCSSHCSVKLE